MVVAADSVQMDPQALARVEQLFKEQIEKGLHPGAGLAVYRHGKPVLDLYGGLADQISGKPVSSGDYVRTFLRHQTIGGGLPAHPLAAG